MERETLRLTGKQDAEKIELLAEVASCSLIGSAIHRVDYLRPQSLLTVRLLQRYKQKSPCSQCAGRTLKALCCNKYGE